MSVGPRSLFAFSLTGRKVVGYLDNDLNNACVFDEDSEAVIPKTQRRKREPVRVRCRVLDLLEEQRTSPVTTRYLSRETGSSLHGKRQRRAADGTGNPRASPMPPRHKFTKQPAVRKTRAPPHPAGRLSVPTAADGSAPTSLKLSGIELTLRTASPKPTIQLSRPGRNWNREHESPQIRVPQPDS